MQPTLLIAIGGNALLKAGERATVAAMRTHVEETCRAVARVVAEGWRVVITHGNGPQVGAELMRSELAARETYPLPLGVCVANTQGEIGFLLQQALGTALAGADVRRPVATVLTQVVVAADGPGFARPTKPIGPFYSRAEADSRRSLGWIIVEVPPHGYRRVVASPEPLEIVEESVIRTLVQAGIVVITLGGGGIPVVRNACRLAGVEAVVDKDLSSALLAARRTRVVWTGLRVMTCAASRLPVTSRRARWGRKWRRLFGSSRRAAARRSSPRTMRSGPPSLADVARTSRP